MANRPQAAKPAATKRDQEKVERGPPAPVVPTEPVAPTAPIASTVPNLPEDNLIPPEAIENPPLSLRIKWCCEKYCNFDFVNICQILCLIILFFISWGILYSVLGEENAGPKSDLICLTVLFVLGKVVAVIIEFIHIPGILGMLGVGVLLKNLEYINLSPQYLNFTAFLRQIAMINILLPAALSLDPQVLSNMSGMVIALSVIPAGVEILAMCVIGKYALSIPWLWSALLGLIMGAVSPAVVIPCLYELEKRGYGHNKGINTLLVAASVIDDIECISLFGVVLGIITCTGTFLWQILSGPIEIVIGIGYGIILGFIAQYIPHDDDEFVVPLRTIFIGGGSILAAIGSHAINFEGAGVLGAFVFAFVAHLRWRRLGWKYYNPVRQNFQVLWLFFEPISFTLIGSEIEFKALKQQDMVMGTVAMLSALILRMLSSMVITKFSDMNFKEILFVAICWIPKATVQAALGPIALDYARTVDDDPQILEYAQCLLTVAVLSIIITSPIGVLLIVNCGPKLLKRDRGRSRISMASVASNVSLAFIPDSVSIKK